MGRSADVELARRCAEGDAAAWERLGQRHGMLLRSAASRALAGWGGVEPEDVVSEVTADLLRDDGRALREYRGDASLASWLWVLATRKAFAMRAAARAAPAGTPVAPEADPSPAPDDLAAMREEIARLGEGMERLPARERLALSLVYLQGWTQQEAARFLGVPAGQAGMLLMRARRRLRESAGIRVTLAPPPPSDG